MNRLTADLWGNGNANPVSPLLQRFDKDAKPWWGKHWMIIQSTATVVFCCFWSPCVRFYWIPQFKAKLLRQSCCAKANPSHLWLKQMVLVLTWASGCGYVHHMQIDRHAQTHLCRRNYVKPRENAEQTDDLLGKLHTWIIIFCKWVPQWEMTANENTAKLQKKSMMF